MLRKYFESEVHRLNIPLDYIYLKNVRICVLISLNGRMNAVIYNARIYLDFKTMEWVPYFMREPNNGPWELWFFSFHMQWKNQIIEYICLRSSNAVCEYLENNYVIHFSHLDNLKKDSIWRSYRLKYNLCAFIFYMHMQLQILSLEILLKCNCGLKNYVWFTGNYIRWF